MADIRSGSVTVFLAVVFEGDDLIEDEETVERLSRAVVREFRDHVWGSAEEVCNDPIEIGGREPDCLVAYPHDSILAGRRTTGEPFDW